MRDTDVLIVGAGPTGLVLALWLTRLGVRLRIIDKTAEPGTTSRALAVQARTLEFHRQLGCADALVERGRNVLAVNMWVTGRKVGRAVFGEMGKGLSPFPYAHIFPQDAHERLLIERLHEAGVDVERRTGQGRCTEVTACHGCPPRAATMTISRRWRLLTGRSTSTATPRPTSRRHAGAGKCRCISFRGRQMGHAGLKASCGVPGAAGWLRRGGRCRWPRHLDRLVSRIAKDHHMDIIDKLESTRARTLKHYELGDDMLDRTYGPGKWSVRFILHHLADTETVLYDRIRRTITEPKQVLWAFDPDKWAAGLEYTDFPLEHSRRIYESVRSGIIHQARRHYEAKGHHQFVHSQTGLRTLKDEFDKVAAHNENHLAHIAKALDA